MRAPDSIGRRRDMHVLLLNNNDEAELTCPPQHPILRRVEQIQHLIDVVAAQILAFPAIASDGVSCTDQ